MLCIVMPRVQFICPGRTGKDLSFERKKNSCRTCMITVNLRENFSGSNVGMSHNCHNNKEKNGIFFPGNMFWNNK